LLPFLYRYLNFSPKFLLPQSFGDKKLPKHLLSQYTQPFANSKQRNGTLAFAKSLLSDQEWFESLWQKRDAIKAIPALFIWGMKDFCFNEKFLKRFRDIYPDQEFHTLSKAGHYVVEDETDKVIHFMEHFYRRVM
jgi:haloalkane dehalogenase